MLRKHKDERATRYCDLFNTPGDINLFVVEPGQRTCWHRHQKQTDQFRVMRGRVLLQKFLDFDVEAKVLKGPDEIFEVPAGWWHGYENIGQWPAFLLMYLDQKYDPTDEETMDEWEEPWLPL